jgi:hypothetical protein
MDQRPRGMPHWLRLAGLKPDQLMPSIERVIACIYVYALGFPFIQIA